MSKATGFGIVGPLAMFCASKVRARTAVTA